MVEPRSERWLRKRYGITSDELVAIVEVQSGCCPLCLRLLGTDIVVDHDHSVGPLSLLTPLARRTSIRGATHRRCNGLLGYLEKYPWLISEHVRKYVDYPPAREVLKTSSIPYKRRTTRSSKPNRIKNGVEYRWCNPHEAYHPLATWRRDNRGGWICRKRAVERNKPLKHRKKAVTDVR